MQQDTRADQRLDTGTSPEHAGRGEMTALDAVLVNHDPREIH